MNHFLSKAVVAVLVFCFAGSVYAEDDYFHENGWSTRERFDYKLWDYPYLKEYKDGHVGGQGYLTVGTVQYPEGEITGRLSQPEAIGSSWVGLVIDDFEDYNDVEGKEIWLTWQDGVDRFYIDPIMGAEVFVLGNGTGSRVNSADIEYIPEKKLLIIPTFLDHRLIAYELQY